MKMKQHWVIGQLCDVLARLASPPQYQIDYLRELGVAPLADELALELDDVSPVVPQLVDQGIMTRQQSEAVYAVSRKLDEMSGSQKADLWTLEALLNHPDWIEVRKLASIAVEVLGCSK